MQQNAGARSRRRESGGDECQNLPVFAFVPMQELDCVYEPECAFSTGTLFPALNKPWVAGRRKA